MDSRIYPVSPLFLNTNGSILYAVFCFCSFPLTNISWRLFCTDRVLLHPYSQLHSVQDMGIRTCLTSLLLAASKLVQRRLRGSSLCTFIWAQAGDCTCGRSSQKWGGWLSAYALRTLRGGALLPKEALEGRGPAPRLPPCGVSLWAHCGSEK